MKRICFSLIAGLVSFALYGQTSSSKFAASISGADRMSIVQTSINIPQWHEKSFWPVYNEYLLKMNEVSSRTFRSLNELATADLDMSPSEAFQSAKNVLSSRREELALRQEYYAHIGKEFNGVIALQFLQTEALLDMVESSAVYDNSRWRNFRFHPTALSRDNSSVAKRNTITKALNLPAEQAQAFWLVYNSYEEDRDAILGENYDMIASYAGEAADFTPALAKRLGYNFLTIMERENTLKEKYFIQMSEQAGPTLAAKFLAWEDYYSLVSKMYAWADSP